MSYYDEIYEYAVDRHYLITTSDASMLGIPVIELAKLTGRGRLENLRNGVYRLSRYVPSESDPYAVAVARLGEGGYLYGESVIALLGLAPTNPDRIFVASPRRVRKKLPDNIVLKKSPGKDGIVYYEGIASQNIKDAIAVCSGSIMPDRLRDAVKRGYEEGYITAADQEELTGELQWK